MECHYFEGRGHWRLIKKPKHVVGKTAALSVQHLLIETGFNAP